MKSIFTERFAANGFLVISALTVLFHLLVLSGIVPYSIVWGGRISSTSQLVMLELVSVGLNLLMFVVVAVKAGLLKLRVKPAIVKGALWAMALLFLLNTVGNLLSYNELEKLLFTPLTLLLALFCIRLALPAPSQKA